MFFRAAERFFLYRAGGRCFLRGEINCQLGKPKLLLAFELNPLVDSAKVVAPLRCDDFAANRRM